MKNIYATISLFISVIALGQAGTLNNAGFENWSLTNSYEQLNTWVTNGGQGQGLVDKSLDAQNLNFSVKLNTVPVNGIPTAGFLALGSFGGGLSGYPYVSFADSMVCYLKYNFLPGDSGTVIVAQFLQGTPIPSFYKVGGVQSAWTRHAFDLLSPFQDSIIILFSAGDFLGGLANVGNTMSVDNVKMKGLLPTAALPNPSFEIWDVINVENPNGYVTSNDFIVQSGFLPNVNKTTDAHSGNFAAILKPQSLTVTAFPGFITNSVIGGASGQAFTNMPDALEGFYKFQSTSSDTANIVVEFWSGGTSITSATLNITTPTNTYTPFYLWIQGLNVTPDTMTFTASSGTLDGILYLDDLQFSMGNVGLKEKVLEDLKVYPNPVNDYIYLSTETNIEEVSLYQLDGKKIKSIESKGVLYFVDVRDLSPGIYLVEVKSKGKRKTQKIIVE